MSETVQPSQTNKKRRITFFVTISIVILFLLAYVGGMIVLPVSILSVYKGKNCKSVLTLNDIYMRIYPNFIKDNTLTGPVMECAVYTLAGLDKEAGAWIDSYNAFDVYSDSYPNGLFVKEAHEHGPTVLISLAKEQVAGKMYTQALGNLNIVTSGYSDTSSAVDAINLFPEIYKAWGSDLRSAGKFAEAEPVFNEFKAWAESNQKTELVTSAQHELAQTYLDWGLALQSQKQFEDANTKLAAAASIDPAPQSNSGPASQVKANQPKFYGEWGDYLVEQKEFARAIEQYKLAASLPENTEPSTALDGIANGYIQWAKDLSTTEDFLGGFKQMDLAQANAATDATKKSVEDARSEIYLAFSNSSGEQAQQAMQAAFRKVCELSEKPDLPIFGLDKKNILAGIYGVDVKLPEKIAATTPGEMHYMACIEVVEETVQFVDFYGFQMFRIRVSWDINLHDVETGKLIETHRIDGEDPPALPTEPGEIAAGGKRQKYEGKPPDIVDLADWLVTVMK